jgi:hypothetical protein
LSCAAVMNNAYINFPVFDLLNFILLDAPTEGVRLWIDIPIRQYLWREK